ncbi:MAG: hypothetical protein HY921_06615 [Elusimicrobia bacterium]|nr:hypothetical protein [Elusimicrobiota bacterium]
MTEPKKVFKVRMSERCFRFKPDALGSHAPPRPGVYEFVTFENGSAVVLYVGLALDKGVSQALGEHMMGQAAPAAAELFAVAKDIYFDYVAEADIESLEDLKDIAAVLSAKHRPRFNPQPLPGTGRYAAVEIEEVE